VLSYSFFFLSVRLWLPHELALAPSLTDLKYNDNALQLPPQMFVKLNSSNQGWRDFMFLYLSSRSSSGGSSSSIAMINHPVTSSTPGTLDLRMMGLDTLPLETFFEGGARSRTCPHWHNYKASITHLDVSHNPIHSLPATLRALRNMTRLDCCETLVRDLPASLAELPDLKFVAATECLLVVVPVRVVDPAGQPAGTRPRLPYPSLIELDVSKNRLVEVCAKFHEVVMLQRLNCSTNALTEIPAEMGKCWRLTELDLSGNQILRLPYELGWLGSVLTRLDVSNNPIWSPPPEVVELGTSEMLRSVFMLQYLQHHFGLIIPPTQVPSRFRLRAQHQRARTAQVRPAACAARGVRAAAGAGGALVGLQQIGDYTVRVCCVEEFVDACALIFTR
jgi:Leucine-rich repeat (LRR) protein